MSDLRKPSREERRTVHAIQRLRHYGDDASLERAAGLEAALNRIASVFGPDKRPLDTSDEAMAWEVRR